MSISERAPQTPCDPSASSGFSRPTWSKSWSAEEFTSILHALILIIFFTVLPVGLGLIAAAIIREQETGAFSAVSRTVLFLLQVVPLVAAGIIWQWLYGPTGFLNGLLNSVGLGGLRHDWLGNFNTEEAVRPG